MGTWKPTNQPMHGPIGLSRANRSSATPRCVRVTINRVVYIFLLSSLLLFVPRNAIDRPGMFRFALLTTIRIHPLVPVRGERGKNSGSRGRRIERIYIYIERERDGKNRRKNEISGERNVAKAVKRKRHTVWYRLAGEAGRPRVAPGAYSVVSRFVLDFCGGNFCQLVARKGSIV